MHYRFDPFSDIWGRPVTRGRTFFMGADVYRDQERYMVVIDVPGVSEEDLDVSVENKTLIIDVNRPSTIDESLELVSRGRALGGFSRRFYLGEGLDSEGVKATLDNGVLTVTIPVVETVKARKIEVGTIRNAIEA